MYHYLAVICILCVNIMAVHSQVIPPQYFGMTVLNFENIVPKLSFGTVRTWDSWPNLDWSDVNNAKGTYRWQWIDDFVSKYGNLDIVYTFGRTPQWASSKPNQPGPYGPGECAPPSDIQYWDDYVTALVNHTQGKIKYYELWNEPQDQSFYCGNISEIVLMAQHANKIIKELQPSAIILSPAPTEGLGWGWMNEFLMAGGKNYIDVISFHGYWNDTAESILYVIQNYKNVMASNGVSNLPMWDSEASWAGGSVQPPTDIAKGSFVAKYYLLQRSAGIDRFIWYAYDAAFWGGLWNTTTNVMLPQGAAYAGVQAWMSGATLVSPCSSNNSTWTCGFERTNGLKSMAIWNSEFNVEYTVPSTYIGYEDLFTGTFYKLDGGKLNITSTPVLLVNMQQGNSY